MQIEHDSSGSAREQLRIAEEARRGAAAPRPAPKFLAPVAGVLVAAGFAWFAVAVLHPGQLVYILVGVACLLVFLGLVVLSSRSGGIVGRPSGPLSRRLALQAVIALPFVLGGVAALFFGLAGCLTAAGIGFGIAATVQIDRARRGGA